MNNVVTPNLTNKFIKAVTANPGQTGGPSISGSTGDTALTRPQAPRHVHSQWGNASISILGGTDGSTYSNVVVNTADSWTGGGGACTTEGFCAPGNQNSLGDPNNSEVGTGHSHSFASVTSLEPAWYSLAFIMRVA